MAENEETVKKSALEQMNEILIDKEKVIDKKREELDAYMVELKNFENQLVQRTQELQAWQLRLEKNERNLNAKWEELRTFETNLQNTTNQVMQEKVKLEQLNKERLESELQMNNSIGNDTRLDLNSLRASIGIDVQEVDVSKVQDVKEEAPVEEIPEFMLRIQEEAEKAFPQPKNYVIETKPDVFCMKIGEKELRVFNKEPLPELHIVVNHKNAKNDSKLQRKLALLARSVPDWVFEPEDNHLVCKMYFTKETKADLVISRCKECMKKIED